MNGHIFSELITYLKSTTTHLTPDKADSSIWTKLIPAAVIVAGMIADTLSNLYDTILRHIHV